MIFYHYYTFGSLVGMEFLGQMKHSFRISDMYLYFVPYTIFCTGENMLLKSVQGPL